MCHYTILASSGVSGKPGAIHDVRADNTRLIVLRLWKEPTRRPYPSTWYMTSLTSAMNPDAFIRRSS